MDILDRLGSDQLALTHPHMGKGTVPGNIEIGVVWPGSFNETTAPFWRACVGVALDSDKLKYLPPPMIVSKGLECVQKALGLSKIGVSGTKLVV